MKRIDTDSDEHATDHADPDQDHWDDVEREAQGRWEGDGRARTEWGAEVGKFEHSDWQDRRRQEETARGRIEGEDYGIEHTMKHPDGDDVRLDYVDFRNHAIVDVKPVADGETVADLTVKYGDQLRRYEEAYKQTYGVTPTCEVKAYRSSKELYRS